MSAAPLVEQLSREMGISTASSLVDGHPPRPVHPVLAPIFRRGGLPRGEIVSLTGGQSLSCALAAIAASTQDQKWCAGIGLGEPAVSSIADLGVDLDHFVNLATPDQDWLRVAAILIESFDILLVDPAYLPSAGERARLLAKVRERKMSVISLTSMPGSTEQIEITDAHWSGTDHGRGRLRSCLVEARSQTGIHRFLLPGPDGTPAEATAPLPTPAEATAPLPAPTEVGGAVLSPTEVSGAVLSPTSVRDLSPTSANDLPVPPRHPRTKPVIRSVG